MSAIDAQARATLASAADKFEVQWEFDRLRREVDDARAAVRGAHASGGAAALRAAIDAHEGSAVAWARFLAGRAAELDAQAGEIAAASRSQSRAEVSGG